MNKIHCDFHKGYYVVSDRDYTDYKCYQDLTEEKVRFIAQLISNAVITQIWIALCAHLVLVFLKFQTKIGQSMQQILRLLQLNLFDRRDFKELFLPPKLKIWLCDR